MSWIVTGLCGLLGMLTGCVGMFGIAHACVKWYRISSFEGGSGYFIVGLSLLGAIVGLLLAPIAARIGYAYVGPQWYCQLGCAMATVMAALALVLAWSYMGHLTKIG